MTRTQPLVILARWCAKYVCPKVTARDLQRIMLDADTDEAKLLQACHYALLEAATEGQVLSQALLLRVMMDVQGRTLKEVATALRTAEYVAEHLRAGRTVFTPEDCTKLDTLFNLPKGTFARFGGKEKQG